MAPTVLSGPPGLEVPHVWTGVDTITLNTRRTNPNFRLTKLTGYYSLPEMTDNRAIRSGRRGEQVYPSLPVGKTIVYEGQARAKTLDGLRLAVNGLKHAFRHRSDEGYFTMAQTGGPTWYYFARVIALDLDDEQTNGFQAVWPWSRGFTLGLRMSDARFYVTPSVTISAASGVVATATNQGSTETDPLFTVVLSATTCTLENLNVTTPAGTTARLRLTGLTSGQTLTVRFQSRTCTMNGVDVSGKIDEGYSQWWDEGVIGMNPGDNSLKVTGGAWSAAFAHASE